MKTLNELAPYFQTLETQDKFSGVVLITQGENQLFIGRNPWSDCKLLLSNKKQTPTPRKGFGNPLRAEKSDWLFSD